MERRAIAIEGTVQGVGFRPFVYRLASAHKLGGHVLNQPDGVRIEVEGERQSLDLFLAELIKDPPPLARIDDWSCERQSPRGDRHFQIDPSDETGHGRIVIAPDAGTCGECLAEIFDPTQRRYRYPFTNCTHCGPRLTIVTGAPYDRQRTTMAGFTMCAECQHEYDDPADRRFHAQPIACPKCGPKLTLLDAAGLRVDSGDPLASFAEAIRTGKIGAMKGLGGYHLICDAGNCDAVAELRRRKHRDEKPFAIMVGDLEAASELCQIDPLSQELLTSWRRPIVLLAGRAIERAAVRYHGTSDAVILRYSEGSSRVGESARSFGVPQDDDGEDSKIRSKVPHFRLATEIAPGNPFIGVMLPYTPLHHLLLAKMSGVALVMTSGNRSDEPIAFDDRDAVERLSGIADIFLTHDRPIHVRCDDSVTRIVDGVESPIRRSRGYAPQPIALPLNCPKQILAVGGQLKATFALGSERRAVVSHHMGDLDNFEAFTAFEKDIALYEDLFAIRPACIAHDLHPNYASTQYANSRGGQDDSIKLVPVQHHHAHMASCMAEHGLRGPVIGVTFDGTGYGTDGAIWGGEFLVGDYRTFRRAAHFRYVGLPGGDKAVREPWRMAAAHLMDAGVNCELFEGRISPSELRIVRTMIQRKFNSPMTSSAGRLFDAVASLIGVRDRVSFEGQAAMELEWLASGDSTVEFYPFEIAGLNPVSRASRPCFFPERAMAETAMIRDEKSPEADVPVVIDTRPMIRAIAHDLETAVAPTAIARKFHATLVEIISAICRKIGADTGITDVVFSGGVFMNALLSTEAARRLKADGLRVHRHRLVPANDGGLSLGQVAIAASRMSETEN